MHDDTRSGLPSFRENVREAWNRSQGTVSLSVISVCVLVYVLISVLNRSGVVPRAELFSVMGLSFPGIVQHHWLFQFLTAPVLYSNIQALLFDMLTLWVLGPELEKTFGRFHYVLFSFLCLASGFVAFLLFHWGTGKLIYSYAGAVFGILVARAMFTPNTVLALGFFPLKMKYAVMVLAGVDLWLTLSPEEGFAPQVTPLVGGAAAFVYVSLFVKRKSRCNTSTSKRVSRSPFPGLRKLQRKKLPELPKTL
mgnify:CR=1 FL=1